MVGKMAVTLKDVAERAGVSKSAVSRTFTEGASVSAEMRRKVLAAAKELGYRPSLIASSLTTKRTKLIGLVANNFQNPIFLEVFNQFTARLQDRDYRPLLVNLTHETDPRRSVDMLNRYSVDGVIVATSTLPVSFAAAFHAAGIPVVHAFGKFDAEEKVNVVGIDNARSGAMAAETLHARGYRTVAVLAGPATATSTQDRVAGFRARGTALGLEIAEVRYAENYAYAAGLEAVQPLLDRDDIEAIFCGDDLICIGAMDASRQRGIAIPEQLGFLGHNDMTMAAWDGYALTTVRQPTREIILSAVELIIAAVGDPDRIAESRLFPCTIVERNSLRPLPAPSSEPAQPEMATG